MNRFNDIFHAIVHVPPFIDSLRCFMHTSAYSCNAYKRSHATWCSLPRSIAPCRVHKRELVHVNHGRSDRRATGRCTAAKLGSLEGLCFLPANSIRTSACQIRSLRLVPQRFYLAENGQRVSSICIVTTAIYRPDFCSCNLVSSPVADLESRASLRSTFGHDQVYRGT